MVGEDEVTKWISPETQRRVAQRAWDRARVSTWDLNVAVFLFGVLAIVIILLSQGVGIEIVAPVAIFGLSMVWLVGWRRRKQLYRRYYDEEIEKHRDEWKDYYKILHISPSAESKDIVAAYQSLADNLLRSLADKTKRLPLHLVMKKEMDEAYQVLSNPIMRNTYDRIFWLKYDFEMGEIAESEKRQMVDLAEAITRDMRETLTERKWLRWRIPVLEKTTRRAVLATMTIILAILIGGTSLAFAKPEHALAAPFRGIAIIIIQTSTAAIGLIEDVREVAAQYERSTVARALQSMRVDLGLKEVPPVTRPTNNMGRFPVREHSLFPDYVETRFSQFRYTVNSQGIVRVHTSWATTDTFLENMKQLLSRLERK